ncbi:hypothetical protein B7494_g1862 [Chlorociboria aeruginascens]|nr:hypothetical protein B7494_g1862 [Chlorociboria aeruginascens]
MDVALEFCDTYIFDYMYAALLPVQPVPYNLKDGLANSTPIDPVSSSPWQFQPSTEFFSFTPREVAYMSSLTRDNIYRQALSLFLITWIGGAIIYFLIASFSYVFIFDKTTFKHPKFLKNQIRQEITQSVISMPFMAILTAPCFLAEARGYSKLYDSLSDGPGTWYDYFQFPFFLIFTDCFAHHKWIMPTPYAAIAFHPVDGFAQSVPYHVFPFIFPLQKFAYLALFVFVQIWTVFIHDGEYVANSPVINGAACHTMHHLYFNYNYGQYTTLWDRLGGSYRKPNEELFRRESKMGKKEWEKQVKEMEKMVQEVEGEDDRSYGPDEHLKLGSKKDL